MKYSRATIAGSLAIVCSLAHGHGGGLNAEGCHNNRKTGDYHCHRAPALAAKAQPAPQQPLAAPSTAGAVSKPASPPAQSLAPQARAAPAGLPPGCFVGPRGGTYTITASGRKNYGGC